MSKEEIDFGIDKKEVDELDEEKEIELSGLSDTPVGEKQKYVRPNLNGKEVKILSAKLSTDPTTTLITSVKNPKVKYRKMKFILTYDNENEQGYNDREFISGAIQFKQNDGSFSTPGFWNKGAQNQSAKLWELVAKFKKIEPDKLSPKQFFDVLNSGITVKLTYVDTEYQKETFHKNMPTEILG